jgi:arylsulfatase
MAKYPNAPEARDYPLQVMANASPATQAARRPCVDPSKLPFDPRQVIKRVPGWTALSSIRTPTIKG